MISVQDRDFTWFVENYDSLYAQYGCGYFAIHDQRVLGVYKTPREAVVKTSQTVPLGQFIVQMCNGDESGYTNYIASAHYEL